MRAEMMPIIRLELQHMKAAMLNAMGLYNNELANAVNQELENAIKAFDFSGVVSKAAREAIEEVIDYYFKYGEGRIFIKDSLEGAFGEMFSKENKNVDS